MSIGFRQEKVIIRLRGRGSRLETRETRTTDRRGWKALMRIGIPGTVRDDQPPAIVERSPVGSGAGSRVTGILHCRVRIELADRFGVWPVDAVPVHAGDQR